MKFSNLNEKENLIGGERTFQVLEKISTMHPHPERESYEEQIIVISQFVHEMVKDLVDKNGNYKKLPVKQYTQDEIKVLEDSMKKEGKL